MRDGTLEDGSLAAASWGTRANVREERMGLTGRQYLIELRQNKRWLLTNMDTARQGLGDSSITCRCLQMVLRLGGEAGPSASFTVTVGGASTSQSLDSYK